MGNRNYTIGERAIIILAMACDEPLEEINSLLEMEQKRTGMSLRHFNERSYQLVKTAYIPKLLKWELDPEYTSLEDIAEQRQREEEIFGNLLRHCLNPKPMNELKESK